jgi:hypothetical protein
LAGLIAAMEHAGRPEVRRQPVAPEVLVALRAQLGLAATRHQAPISTLRH